MELLRSKGKMTRVLVLVSVVIDRRSTAASIAGSVGITPQGASEYITLMRSEGLLVKERGGIRATVKGVDHLQKALLSLKGFADRTIEGLEIVRSTDAIAAERVRKGDRVSLIMRGGLMYAWRGDGSSWGIADSDASENEMVQVSSLSGMVEMDRRPIRLVPVPPARSGGGASRIERKRFREHVVHRLGSDPEEIVVAALDMEGAAMLLRSRVRMDLQMPCADTLVGYQDRGRAVLAFGTPHSISVLEERLAASRPGPPCTERYDGLVPV